MLSNNTELLEINRRIIIIYVILSYSITWAILFPLSVVYNNLDHIIREIWHSFGSIGPTIGGMIALYLLKQKGGLRLLKERLMKYAGYKLLLFAFTPILILIIVLIFETIFGVFNFAGFFLNNDISTPLSFLIFVLPSFCYGFFEEIGWRGFLLPHLQTKYKALKATLILTVIWWFWHFPTFFYRFDFLFAFAFMFPLMLSGSIVFTYLFNQSGGSVLMVIILHICYDLVSSSGMSVIAVILVSVFYISMDIRAIKLYGMDNLSTKNRIFL